jgi:hypothetical protein
MPAEKLYVRAPFQDDKMLTFCIVRRRLCRQLVPKQRTGHKGCELLVELRCLVINLELTRGLQLINQVGKILAQNPSECLILEGYSQGATVVVDALRKLTGPAFDAVKGVFLIGNTRHERGLACNVDMQGGDKTKYTTGILYLTGMGIPTDWVPKTLDVCNVVSRLFSVSTRWAQ